MRVLPIGMSGQPPHAETRSWEALGLPTAMVRAARVLSGAETVRPIQARAAEAGVFNSRRNVLVAAPTNSGKTLVGALLLCEALARGQRAVLLEPLRALAQEKADDLCCKHRLLSEALGVPVRIAVSTGDYRLEGETFADPAPGAELIIATPERLESILRVPENEAWFAGLGAVCVDEAHLLADPRRGATLEYLITSLLMLPMPPRLALLSATIGSTEALAEWLRPCDVISVAERTPPLDKWLLELEEGADANTNAAEWLRGELASPASQALVFIHQARQTAGAAEAFSRLLGPLAGAAGAFPYNSQMSPAQRQRVREQFVSGASRVVVATSALAMGVNLPATHVVVRDLTYIGTRSPGVAEILQMMGRAGRGDCAGKALVIKRQSDHWQVDDLIERLRVEALPPLVSAFSTTDRSRGPGQPPPATEVVASMLLRAGDAGRSPSEIEAFFQQSFGGRGLALLLPAALRWLQVELLAYQDPADEKVRLTRLGSAAVRAVLPLRVGAGLGRLTRDLLSLSEDAETFGRWGPLDFLVTLELLHDDTPSLRRFSGDLANAVVTWCEGHPQLVPMLFRRWLRGEKGHSAAAEVLGSMVVEPPEAAADKDEWARQRGFLAVFNAIVLYERSAGRSVADLERQFGIGNLEGVEERWRDTMLWLLAGVSQVLDVKAFYFHLKESCEASPERIKAIKHSLVQMKMQALDLMERVKWASPLGGFVVSMRRQRGKAGVGVESIRRLEAAGITQIQLIARMSVDELASNGIRRDIARRIHAQARRMLV